MQVVFTYLPIRLKEVTEIYLKYSIKSLNEVGVIPIIYSDIDYFIKDDLNYKWIEFDIDSKYKVDTLWSYPKLKVLSEISFPFIHLDNDLIVGDYIKLKNIIKPDKLNLGYKHPLTKIQTEHFTEIYKLYSNTSLEFNELNNTCIIATNNHKDINKTYSDALNIVDSNYNFFIQKYKGIPPITLNQQYLNHYFNDINYLFNENPAFENLENNGVCHIAEKNIAGKFIKNKTLM